MALSIGSRLGVYEVTSKIGEGGMGEVYRARDMKLNRDVAIKVLPDAFASQPERLARFTREAQTLASLNHPNIAHVHGLEVSSTGQQALVMELVEGNDLSTLIARGDRTPDAESLGSRPRDMDVRQARGGGAPRGLSIEDALAIAKQIAQALEAAHEQGIVHRDLKPANIKVRSDGTVKVLDFGLAKALDPAAASSADAMNSPTLTSPAMTEAGLILGTAAYMSPEQARGQAVDKRADLWAFGVVLWEMLTGTQLFVGPTVSDTLAAVLRADPDWTVLPANTPAAVVRLLRRTLQKDRQRRLDSAAAARLDIEDALAAPDAVATIPAVMAERRAGQGRSWAWTAVAAVVAAALTFAAMSYFRQPAVETDWRGDMLGGPPFALGPHVSPDGQMVAFQVMENGLTQVGIMRLRSAQWTTLTHDRDHGTVTDLAWSPDGSSIYFDRIKDVPQGIYRVPVLGGEPRLVLEKASSPAPLADGTLVVTQIDDQRRRQIFRFWPETGRLEGIGALTPPGMFVNAIRAFPDGREVVFYGRPLATPDVPNDVYAVDLTTHAARRLGTDALRVGQFVVETGWAPAIAPTPDNKEVLVAVATGDIYSVVALPRHGASAPRKVISLTGGTPFSLEVAPDEAIHTSLASSAFMFLRAPVGSTAVERIPARIQWGAIALSGGRMLAAVQTGGQWRVMVMTPGKDPVPLLETAEETTGPLAVLGTDRVLLLVGASPNKSLAIASLADGRIVKRIDGVNGGEVQAVAGSPDGRTVYYAANNVIWAVGTAGGSPRKLHAGNSVAIDPGNTFAVISLNEQASVRLLRVPLDGGTAQEIPVRSDRFGISPSGSLMSNAVDASGRIIVCLAPKDSWFYPVGLLDPRTGTVTKVWPDLEADMWGGWTDDGRVLAGAREMQSALWRFTRVGERK